MSLSSHHPTSGVTRHKINRAEYHLLSSEGLLPREGKVELIDGEIFEMSPAVPLHSTIVDEIYDLIRNKVSPGVAKIRNEKSMVLNDFSEPEPDIAIVRPGNYMSNHPCSDDVLLLIEVSKSSIEFDREVKLPAYAASGIPELWIINLNEGTVEIYQDPKNSGFESKQILNIKSDSMDLIPVKLPDFTFSLGEISFG